LGQGGSSSNLDFRFLGSDNDREAGQAYDPEWKTRSGFALWAALDSSRNTPPQSCYFLASLFSGSAYSLISELSGSAFSNNTCVSHPSFVVSLVASRTVFNADLCT
jgi:hypothetical protein